MIIEMVTTTLAAMIASLDQIQLRGIILGHYYKL